MLLTNVGGNNNGSAVGIVFDAYDAAGATPTAEITNTRINPGDYALSMGPIANLSALTIRSSGYVGIGTTLPAVSLDISQGTNALALPGGTSLQRPGSPINGEIRYNSSTPGIEGYYSGAWNALGSGSGGSGTITLGTSASATNPQRSGDATTGLYSPAANSVAVSAAGTEKMRVTGVGIGVGTASPAATLHVAGEAIVGSTGLSCSSTTAGAVQYATGLLQFCNGTTWQTINSAAAGGITPGCGSSGTLASQMQTTLNVAVGCHVLFKVWGGGGGGSSQGSGGAGGYATITLGPLGSATTYYLVVGGGGFGQNVGATGGIGATGFNGGDSVGPGGCGNNSGCGGGGAASGVWTGGYGTSGTPVVVAAGGGGGGFGTGVAGGSTGGSQNSTSAGQSGATFNSAGGGAGYPTGGAGGSVGSGGTDYAATGGSTSAGSATTPGNVGDPNYPTNAGSPSGANASPPYNGAIYYLTY